VENQYNSIHGLKELIGRKYTINKLKCLGYLNFKIAMIVLILKNIQNLILKSEDYQMK